jgi:hypothetical protein
MLMPGGETPPATQQIALPPELAVHERNRDA